MTKTVNVPNRDKFVAYWKAVDSNYSVKIDGVQIESFFEKLANRLLAELDEVPVPDASNASELLTYVLTEQYKNDEFYQLYYAAAPQYGGEKFKKVGDSYKALAEKLNTGIQPACIYKKVVE